MADAGGSTGKSTVGKRGFGSKRAREALKKQAKANRAKIRERAARKAARAG